MNCLGCLQDACACPAVAVSSDDSPPAHGCVRDTGLITTERRGRFTYAPAGAACDRVKCAITEEIRRFRDA